MNNKKFRLIVAFVMAASVCAQAQGQKFSKWTVTPRVGFNVSNLVYGKAPGKDSKLGFTGGADVEYRPFKLVGVSLGCYFYSQNSSVDYTVFYRDHYTHIDQRFHTWAMQNVSFPLLLNAHVWKGLTVKVGAQLVWWTYSRMKYKTDGYYIERDWNTGPVPTLPDGVEADGEKMPYYRDGDWQAKDMKYSLTMPVALSYAYKNIELDVRYQVGAYKLWANDCPNHHPKSLVVTLGYNLHMK